MLVTDPGFFQRQIITLCGRSSGMVSNAPTGGGMLDEGVGLIIVSSIVGAFCGLLAGFILAHLFRFLSVVMGRNLGGYSWVFIGAAIGAVVFAAIAATNDEE
jgi:NhaP-type Na+/H+ or K+/H+ antiporter